MHQALAARGVAFRRSAEHVELAGLLERSMPVAADRPELDNIHCSATADWVADDVRTTVADKCGIALGRLRGLYVNDALAPENATFGELTVAEGALLRLVVGSAGDEPGPSRGRAESAKAAVVRQRARDEKKQNVAAVRALLVSGEQHQRRGEWRPAADCYSQAIIAIRAGNPALQNLLSNRGLCRSRMGEYRDAWMDHDRALEQAPSMHSRTLHYLNRGNCAVRLGMLEEAHDDFEVAALHASTSSVSSGAAKQLQRVKKPLYTAFEGHFEWLRQYYPAVGLSQHCASVESFKALCKKTREMLGRQIDSIGKRHDESALVHKRALETICNDNDMDPGPIAEGARAEFERLLKQEATALLKAETESPEAKRADLEGPIAASESEQNTDMSTEFELETLHESQTREARENKEKWIETQGSMVGNEANGFVLMRERKAVYAISHRGDAAGADVRKTAQRPATAPASSYRSRPSSADTTGLHSTISVGSTGLNRRSKRSARRDISLETTFRRLLPTSVAGERPSGHGHGDEHGQHPTGGINSSGTGNNSTGRSSREHARPRTALSQKQKQKFIAQQRSVARLSKPETGSKPKAATKVIVGGIAMETPAQKQATDRKMERFRKETQRRLLRPVSSTPCAGQLYDTVSYAEKTNPHGGPPGNMFRGRAERVGQMALSPDVVSMESLLGDWTKADAAAHFFNNYSPGPVNRGNEEQQGPQRPKSATPSTTVSSSNNQGSTNNQVSGSRTQWSAWSAWQEELSYRQCEEAKSGGTSDSNGRLSKLTVRGCNAGMLSVPRFLAVP